MRTAICLTALFLASAGAAQQRPDNPDEPYGAEDYGSQDNVVHIPEPMVFDLVRGLGADQGEFEANVLVQQPLQDTGVRPTDWAPEVEAAIFDGFALEFELPFEDGELVAEKYAVQWTFAMAADNQFIHGTQVIAERLRESNVWELSFLYVPGYRFNKTWSTLWLVGIRAFAGGEHDYETETLVNGSVFADVSYSVSLGFEANVAAEFSGDTSVLLMPQVHWELTDHFMIQAGVGATFIDDETLPEATTRVIYSF